MQIIMQDAPTFDNRLPGDGWMAAGMNACGTNLVRFFETA